MTIFTRPLADKGKAAPAEVNELEKGLTVPAQAVNLYNNIFMHIAIVHPYINIGSFFRVMRS